MNKYFTIKTVGISIVVLFALYLLLTGLVAPWAGKKIAIKSLTETLGRQTAIESITFNPFTLEARVKNFAIESKIQGEKLASVQELYLNLSASSLIHLAPVVQAVQVTAPKFALHLNKDNTLNISDLLEAKDDTSEPEPEAEEDEDKALFEFKVSNIKIEDASLVFTDHIRSVTHSVENLNFDLPVISTMKKDLTIPVKAALNCLVDKARLDVNVEGVPFDATRKMSVALDMQSLDLNTFKPYIDLPAPYKIKSAGDLALSVSGEYEIPAGKTAEDQTFAFNLKTLLKNFDLNSVSGTDLFACPQLAVDASSQNVFDMNFTVDKVLVDKASVFVERNAQGGINLVPSGQGAGSAQPAQPDTLAAQAENSGTPVVAAQTAKTDAAVTKAVDPQDAVAKEETCKPAKQAAQAQTTENQVASDQTTSDQAASDQAASDQAASDQATLKEKSAIPAKPVVSLSLPFTVKVSQAAVKNMHIRFSDKMVSPQVDKEITSLDFVLTDIEVGSKVLGKFDLNIQTGDNESIKTAGDFLVENDISANGTVAVDGIALENYRAYLAPYLGDNVSLENVSTSLNFAVGVTCAGLGVQVSDGKVTLDQFGLTEQGKKDPLVQFDQLALSGISCDLLKQDARVGLVELHKATARINRDRKGEMDLLVAINQALKKEDETKSNTKKKTTAAKTAQAKQATGKQGVNSDAAAAAPAWVATIDKTVLDQCQFEFIDKAKKEPVKVLMKNIGVTVENLSTKKGETSTFKVFMTNKNKGKINLDGSFDILGPAATVNIDLNRIDVNTAEPYFTDFLKISISKGYLNTKGTVVVTPAKRKNRSPKIRYKGRVSLNNFLSKNKVDNTDFFSCKSLYATGIDVSVNPTKVVVKKIALTDFYQQAILNKDAQLNYKQIIVEQPETKSKSKSKPTAKAKTAKSGSDMPDIRIDSITLQGGHINFSDYFTRPNFTANMTQIAGSLTGLSSRGKEHAKLLLKGVHGGYAPLDITGQVDPLKSNRFIDLTVSFKNIELPKFNVYSKKYLGYEIEKGKLILDLHYNIDGDKLNSSNRVLFDQFTLGQKVESEDAPSLPLELAVSLLKNAKGEIDLDLPITGDISDPEFHFGKVVGTVLRNFIMGVVTAPFKFLGGLAGAGDQDLGYVDFDPGKSTLDQAQKDKLDKLISILTEKAGLKLEILAQYNEQSDAEKLRYDAFETLVLSMGWNLPTDGTVKLADLEEKTRTGLIEKAYKKATFPKPRDENGKEKELTLAEKEKLLVTSMPLDGDALNALGRDRGYEISNYLTETGKLDLRRVFVTEPDPVAEKEQSNPRVKVTFNLK